MSPTCTLLLTCSRAPHQAMLDQALRLMAARPGAAVLLVAHGDHEAQADALRDFADHHPGVDLLLHTRRESADRALSAGVAAARSDWIAWVDLDRHVDISIEAACAATEGIENPGGLDWFRAEFGLLVFPRDAWGKIRRIPWTSRVLPELLEQAGLKESALPSRAGHRRDWAHRLHSLYIRQAGWFGWANHGWNRARA